MHFASVEKRSLTNDRRPLPLNAKGRERARKYSFENPFVHEGHEGTRRKIFVYLRVLGGYFHPSWRAITPMSNSFENTFFHEGHEGTRRKNLRVFVFLVDIFIHRGGRVLSIADFRLPIADCPS